MKKSTKVMLVLFIIASMGGVLTYMGKTSKPVSVTMHSIFPDFTKEEFIRQSEAIIIGHVKSLETTKVPSDTDPDEEHIVTYATIRVENYLRNYSGRSPEEIVVETLGGTVGNVSMYAEDAASFEKGERVLVFLVKKNENAFTVAGWARGKYSIDESGAIGTTENERFHMQEIFDKPLTLGEIKAEIEAFKNISPRLEIPGENYADDKAITPEEKNIEAGKALQN